MTTSGVGGTEPSKPTDQTQGPMPLSTSGGSGMDTKVKTLSDLKAALMEQPNGEQLYNQFINSMAASMVIQSQSAATRAQQAAKQMRESP